MRAKKVGCAVSKYRSAGIQYFYFVCNYSFGNVLMVSVYSTGPSGSKCKSGRDTVYKGVCIVEENILPIV